MNQDFQGAVFGDVAGRDVVNQIHHDASRALTSLERIELNNRVKQLTENFAEPGWKTWRYLHRTIGIENIEEMRLDHRDSAHAILDLLIERAELQKCCSQRQCHDEDSSGNLAGLVLQNSELTARLKESLAMRKRIERRLDEAVDKTKTMSLLLESSKLGAEKYEKLFANSVGRSQQLEDGFHRAKKRANRLLALIVLFALTTSAGIAATFYQTTKTNAAEARLSVCEFDGKAYAVGGVIDGTPDRECVRVSDGRSVWKAVSEKARRTK